MAMSKVIALVPSDRPPPTSNGPTPEVVEKTGPRGGVYRATPDGFTFVPGYEDAAPIPISNFVARIVTRTVDDEGEVGLTIEIHGPRGTLRLDVTPAEFNSLRWVPKVPGAVLWAGAGVAQNFRVAAQLHSEDVMIERRVVTSLGWHEVGGRQAFAHAHGLLGDSDNTEVAVTAPLDRFVLPAPPTGDRLREVIRDTARLLTLGPGTVMTAMLGATFRAPVDRCDFSVLLAGRTGTGKSAAAALFQSAFGAGMALGHQLPSSWASTTAALEMQTHAAAGCLLVIDDWVPAGSNGARTSQGSERDLDRLLRAASAGAGRSRMRGGSYHPRCLIVTTAEGLPEGQSLLARCVVLDLEDGLRWDRLTAAQERARAGVHAECMAAYLHWLAPHLDEARAWLRHRVDAMRPSFELPGLHRRTAGAVADLEAGFVLFLRFAVQAGVLAERDADEVLVAAQDRLREVATYQLDVQQRGAVGRLFLTRVGTALRRGELHLQPVDGSGAEQRGDRVGWSKGSVAYLDPVVAMRMVEDLEVSESELGGALRQEGLLARSGATDKGRYKTRLMVAGQRRRVLAVPLGLVDAVGQVDQRQQPCTRPFEWGGPLGPPAGAHTLPRS